MTPHGRLAPSLERPGQMAHGTLVGFGQGVLEETHMIQAMTVFAAGNSN